MRMVNYAQEIEKALLSCKKVGRTPNDLSERIQKFLEQVDQLNAL